jgi:hypothetical protein
VTGQIWFALVPLSYFVDVEGRSMVTASVGIPEINVGDTVNFVITSNPTLAVLAVYPTSDQLLIIADPSTGGDPDFIVTMYEAGGDGTAKMSLEWTDGNAVMADDGSAPVQDAMMLGAGPPAQFLLTDTGNGVTMQVIFPGELGYLGAAVTTTPSALTSGHPSPDASGFYSITVEP